MSHKTFKVLSGATLSVFFVLSSCTRTEWAVKFADTYISWKLIDHFDFESDAKDTVKKETAQLVRNFRKDKFPALSTFFFRSSNEFSQLDLSSEKNIYSWVSKKMEESDSFLDSLNQEIEPFALKITSLVEKENWQSFVKNFEKENNKILKTKSKCASKFEDHLDDWMGSLNDDQEEAIKTYCASRGAHQENRVKNRQFMFETFRSQAEPQGEFEPVAFEAAVKKWVASYRSLQHPETKEQWKTNKENLKKAFTQILLHSNDSQKRKFSQQLMERSKSLQKLSL